MDKFRRIFLSQIIILIAIVFSAFTEKYMVSCIVVPILSIFTIAEVIRIKKNKGE